MTALLGAGRCVDSIALFDVVSSALFLTQGSSDTFSSVKNALLSYGKDSDDTGAVVNTIVNSSIKEGLEATPMIRFATLYSANADAIVTFRTDIVVAVLSTHGACLAKLKR